MFSCCCGACHAIVCCLRLSTAVLFGVFLLNVLISCTMAAAAAAALALPLRWLLICLLSMVFS
jgi:hypothetical protein